MEVRLLILQGLFSVSKIDRAERADLSVPFTFLSVTDEESSLVCPEKATPAQTMEREDGWRCLKIEGVLEFSMVGVIAGISGVLRDEGISIFVVSTFHTDYILIKEAALGGAVSALRRAGYTLM